MNRNVKLTPDQFEIDNDGHLVISNDEITEAIQYQQAAAVPPPEEAIKIEISMD